MRDLLLITKALADTGRLRILCALAARGELCVCQLQELLGLAPSSTSRHLALLAAARLVVARKDGRWVHYRLPAGPDEAPAAALDALAWLGRCCGVGDGCCAPLLPPADVRVLDADRARLDAILRLTPEQLCQLQHQGLACCSSAPATPVAARSPRASRARSTGA